jgi:hypothetical protein
MIMIIRNTRIESLGYLYSQKVRASIKNALRNFSFMTTIFMAFPALGVGMSKVHTTDEFIKEADLYFAAQYVTAILQTAAVTAGRA